MATKKWRLCKIKTMKASRNISENNEIQKKGLMAEENRGTCESNSTSFWKSSIKMAEIWAGTSSDPRVILRWIWNMATEFWKDQKVRAEIKWEFNNFGSNLASDLGIINCYVVPTSIEWHCWYRGMLDFRTNWLSLLTKIYNWKWH